MQTPIDYLHHLSRESARFGEVARDLPGGVRVPSCPDWDADDLLWHLGCVQRFWGTVVRDGLTGAQVEQTKTARPPDHAALLDFYEESSRRLAGALAAASPEDPAWTWSDDQSVGFIRRRQVHEALMHRVDAEEAAGARTAMDPVLSADGVDEALRVLYCGVPDWGTFTPDGGRRVRLLTADTGDSWLIDLGRFTGTDPEGTFCDEVDIHIADAAVADEASATVTADAADFDCWLWHRSLVGKIEFSGAEDVLRDFQSVIARGLG